MTPKNITIPLRVWLRDKLDYHECAKCVPEIGILISQIDKDEEFTHIEFPPENSKEAPIVWDIRAWRETAEHRERLKAYLAESTAKSKQRESVRNKIAKELEKQFGIKGADKKTKAIVQTMIEKIITSRQASLSDVFGVDLDNVPEAEYIRYLK